MKRKLVLIPLLIISCKKESTVSQSSNQDSVMVSERKGGNSEIDSLAVVKRDSIINNAPMTKEVLSKGVMRNEKEGQIIRTADAEQLPFKLGEQFTKDGEELVLKIINYNQPTIKASIASKEEGLNIRFNQIKLPNGDYDGPFGKEITYEVKGKGEIWLIIGKNNMASGNTTGRFTVSVE